MLRLLKPELAGCAYAREIDAVLPRVLALADTDPFSTTRGFGDRQYWSWKLIDFPNGTLQGAVNGIASLLAANAFSAGVSRDALVERIRDMMEATARMMRRDGSFEEALPYEQSYCVTALVAYDHLTALERLPDDAEVPHARSLERAIGFLVRRDETHALIANHLATAAAALVRWDRLCGERRAREKADLLVSRILDTRSEEGWFVEYGGADPGYQTLSMAHLADVAEMSGNDRLWDALGRATGFIGHFVHPDGSFGGVYGSRATRIYYPAAMEMLAPRFEAARAIAARMRRSIGAAATVPLASIDQPNLMPLFNNYCEALLRTGGRADVAEWAAPAGRHWFPEAGLLIDTGQNHQTIVSTAKGGVVYHWRNGKLATLDTGLALDNGRGAVLTSQNAEGVTVELAPDRVSIAGKLTRRRIPTPGVFNFLVLRVLAVTVMRIPSIGAKIKSIIAALLVRPRGGGEGSYKRQITLGEGLEILDEWQPSSLKRRAVSRPFSTIHMASSGYWQRQDTSRTEAEVPFNEASDDTAA